MQEPNAARGEAVFSLDDDKFKIAATMEDLGRLEKRLETITLHDLIGKIRGANIETTWIVLETLCYEAELADGTLLKGRDAGIYCRRKWMIGDINETGAAFDEVLGAFLRPEREASDEAKNPQSDGPI